MELKFLNGTNFIKFLPPQVEILRETHHYPIHPGHDIHNIPASQDGLLQMTSYNVNFYDSKFVKL